ncbi:MAG TPA: glycosyltransferase family 9 protein [Thermodesulfobacteriota bacterium]
MSGKALVIRFGALGDVLHTTPAVRALAAAGYAVDYLTGPGAVPLVEGQPDIRRVLRYDHRRADRGVTGFLRLVRRLRAERYDVVADLQGNTRSRLIGLAVGAPKRVRYRKDRPGTPRHAVQNFAATLAPLGLAAEPGAPRFVPPPEARAAAEAALAAAGGVPAGRALVALHIGASQPLKTWAPARFGRLAALLAAEPGLSVVLTSAPEDRAAVDEALAVARDAGIGPGRLLDLGGRLDLAALGACYARAAAVVVADTGPLHLAAAAGARTVGLFGPTDPVRTGPYGPGHRVVQTALDCVPCRAKRCRRSDRPRACLEEMSPETVREAVLAVIGRERL